MNTWTKQQLMKKVQFRAKNVPFATEETKLLIRQKDVALKKVKLTKHPNDLRLFPEI